DRIGASEIEIQRVEICARHPASWRSGRRSLRDRPLRKRRCETHGSVHAESFVMRVDDRHTAVRGTQIGEAMRIAIAPIFMAASLSAQSGGFGAPQLAVIYRAGTGTLHPVGGVAAANRTGRAIGGVPKLEQAIVAHDGGFALGVSDQGQVVLARLSNGRAQEVG